MGNQELGCRVIFLIILYKGEIIKPFFMIGFIIRNSMIRVLHIVGKMDMAGLETMLMNFYRNIDRNEIQFDFLPLSGEKGYYDDEIVSLGGEMIYPPSRYDWKKPWVFRKWYEFVVKEKGYSVVHSHNGGAAAIVLPIAKKNAVATMVHSHHASDSEAGIKAVVRKVVQQTSYKYVDSFLACSKEAGRFLFGERDFAVINNAIKLDEFIFNSPVRSRVRKELGIEDCFVLGTVGRLTAEKNPRMVVRIGSRLCKKYPQCKFVWVGKGELEDEIKRILRDENLEDNIIMLGAVSNVNEVLQAMDTFIFPSLHEGLGIAAIEAQAAGLPTLCSDQVPRLAAVTDLCDFIEVDDADKWVEAIETIMEHPLIREDKSEEIRKAGFDIRCETQKLASIYRKLQY